MWLSKNRTRKSNDKSGPKSVSREKKTATTICLLFIDSFRNFQRLEELIPSSGYVEIERMPICLPPCISLTLWRHPFFQGGYNFLV